MTAFQLYMALIKFRQTTYLSYQKDSPFSCAHRDKIISKIDDIIKSAELSLKNANVERITNLLGIATEIESTTLKKNTTKRTLFACVSGYY